LLRSFTGEVSGSAKDLGLGDERVYRVMPSPLQNRPCVPARELPLRTLEIKSSASEGLERLRDRDPATSWSTVNPQKEGDFLEFHGREDRPLAAIRLVLGSRVSDFPTALRVDTAGASGEWQESEIVQPVESAIATLRQLLASDPAASITMRIPPIEARSLRLRVGRDENRPPWNPWSVAEIQLFSECSDNSKP
jgi:hypothetical protein